MKNNILSEDREPINRGGAPILNTNAAKHNRYNRKNRQIHQETITLLHSQQQFLADFNENTNFATKGNHYA